MFKTEIPDSTFLAAIAQYRIVLHPRLSKQRQESPQLQCDTEYPKAICLANNLPSGRLT
jgi:hypothetical protein